ncbi:MAG: hypothetical protein II265_07965 [Clostridia bacterium]|nr:hypothetical protein [Clostridia bacterium]
MATSEKIQLKGAAQYKKDLQQIVAQSKALSAEMKAVKTSFDKTTSAEEKNEAINKQLNKQIDVQQKLVDKLAQAYEAEVAASGDQSVAAQKAKEALMKGQATLNQLEAENRELAEAENTEAEAARGNEKAHSSLNGVLKTAGAAVAAVAAAAAAAAKAIWDMTNAAGEWADNLLTMSAQTNLSVDTLQKWDYAARFIDVDSETMVKGIAKVTKMQAQSMKTGEDYVTMLNGQQIALKGSNGELKTSEQLFLEMVDAVGKIADDTEREAAAQDLFGKSYQEIMPLIKAGSEGLKAYGEEAESLGLILSGDAVDSLGKFDDQMQRLKATMETAGRQLALSFLPATQQVAEQLTDLASTVTTALSDGFQEADVDVVLEALFDKLSQGMSNLSAIMPAVAKFVVGLVTKIVDFVTQNAPLLMDTALQIILALANGLAENLPTMIPAIVEMVMTIVTTLTDPENIDMLMQAAIALMTGLANGLIAAVPVLVASLPQLMTNIVEALITQSVRMYQAASAMINNLAAGLQAAFTSLITKVGGWVNTNIIAPIKEKGIAGLKTAGANLVTGLWNGINDKLAWIKDKITSWVGKVVDWFKQKFGVHSPSTVFMGIGENLAEGLAIGWKDGMSYVKDAMGMVPGFGGSFSLDASPAGLGGVTVYIDGIKYNTDEYVDSSITNFVESMVRRGQMYGR